jgi:hypothetical protein
MFQNRKEGSENIERYRLLSFEEPMFIVLDRPHKVLVAYNRRFFSCVSIFNMNILSPSFMENYRYWQLRSLWRLGHANLSCPKCNISWPFGRQSHEI